MFHRSLCWEGTWSSKITKTILSGKSRGKTSRAKLVLSAEDNIAGNLKENSENVIKSLVPLTPKSGKKNGAQSEQQPCTTPKAVITSQTMSVLSECDTNIMLKEKEPTFKVGRKKKKKVVLLLCLPYSVGRPIVFTPDITPVRILRFCARSRIRRIHYCLQNSRISHNVRRICQI